MFMIALLAVAMVPLLLQGMRLSASNATMATATQLVDRALDKARSKTECGGIDTTTEAVSDSRGVPLTVTRTLGSCPAAFPGTVKYTVTVTLDDDDADPANDTVLATAATFVYVTGP